MSDNVYNAILSNEITGYCFELAVGGICYIYKKKKTYRYTSKGNSCMTLFKSHRLSFIT